MSMSMSGLTCLSLLLLPSFPGKLLAGFDRFSLLTTESHSLHRQGEGPYTALSTWSNGRLATAAIAVRAKRPRRPCVAEWMQASKQSLT